MPARQGWLTGLLRRVIRAWCQVVHWRLEVSAVPLPCTGDLPGSGCVVVAAPHRSWVEPFLLLAAWPRDAARLVWLADGRTVTRSWWRRRLLPRLGIIPIDVGAGGPRAYAELAAGVLEAGHAIAVFPEVGPTSGPDRPRHISRGFAYLALRTGAPIIPAVIGGTHRIARGSSFSVDLLDAIQLGTPEPEPFTPSGREHAREAVARYQMELGSILPRRTKEADARAPTRERWTWLGRLFD